MNILKLFFIILTLIVCIKVKPKVLLFRGKKRSIQNQWFNCEHGALDPSKLLTQMSSFSENEVIDSKIGYI